MTPERTVALAGFESVPESSGNAASVRESKRLWWARHQAEGAEVEIPGVADAERRKTCMESLPLFLRTYFPEEFSRPFDTNMADVCALAEATVEEGGRFVCVLPRGSGKTVTLTRAGLWAVLSGRRRFVVVLGASDAAARRLLAMLQADLSANPLLLADFPEVCEPFRVAGGQAIRLRGLRHDGTPLGAECRRDQIVLPFLDRPGSAAQGQVLLTRGLTGAIRGLNHSVGGAAIRPDFVLIDDPQTDKSAKSESQTKDRLEIIQGTVLGLAGPEAKPISALVAATVIARDDLAERLLQSDRFTARHFKLVESWGGTDELWDEYDALWRGQGAAAAARFYEANRDRLEAGAVVPCGWRVREGELSALHTARNLLLEMGDEAFGAEMQGEPPRASVGIYDLTEKRILDNLAPFAPGEVPPSAKVLVAHTDINRSGLHWCAVAFWNDMSAHVVAYGNVTAANGAALWPEYAPENVKNACINAGLQNLVRMFAAAPFVLQGRRVRPATLLIDAGYSADTVHGFVERNAMPFLVYPAIGRAAHKYGWHKETIIGRPYEHAHLQKTDRHPSPYVMFDADHWRSVSQRAFLGAPGTQGALTLFTPAAGKLAHREFAGHVLAERLVQTYETHEGLRYEWTHQPGSVWDWGDALTGCFAAAAMCGLTTTGYDNPAKILRKTTIKTARI